MKEYCLQEAEFSEMVQAVYSNDQEDQLIATKKFRQCSAITRISFISAMVDTGIVPKFVEFLEVKGNYTLQFNAAWTLENIASGTSEHTRVVVDAGAVPAFVKLLRTKFQELQNHVVGALGNIAGDSSAYRDLVLEHGVMEPLLQLLKTWKKSSVVKTASWLLNNLCRGKEPSPDFEKVSPCLPVLSKLLFHNDWEVLRCSCWALAYLSDGPNDKIQVVIESGVCKRIIELLTHPSQDVVYAAVRVVGNIVTGDNDQTQVIVNNSALPQLLQLLRSSKHSVRYITCWTISNITAGTQAQIQAVIDANIFPTLIDIVEKAELKTKREAAWAITNAASSGTAEQIRYLVELNCIPHLCDLLVVTNSAINRVALTGLAKILRQGDQDAKNNVGVNPYADIIKSHFGIDKIKFLQKCGNVKICKKVNSFVVKYFDPEERAILFPSMDENASKIN